MPSHSPHVFTTRSRAECSRRCASSQRDGSRLHCTPTARVIEPSARHASAHWGHASAMSIMRSVVATAGSAEYGLLEMLSDGGFGGAGGSEAVAGGGVSGGGED